MAHQMTRLNELTKGEVVKQAVEADLQVVRGHLQELLNSRFDELEKKHGIDIKYLKIDGPLTISYELEGDDE